MHILIVTRSFVREVSALVKYACAADPSLSFSLVMPAPPVEPLPASVTVSVRRPYFSRRMRATCYGPSLIADINACTPDILHLFEEFSGLIAFQTLLCNRLLGRKSKVMIYSAENLCNNLRCLFKLSGHYVASHSDLAYVCSHGVRSILRKAGYEKPITVFPLGVNTDMFSKFPVFELKTHLKLDGKFVIGYIGRLLEIKGVYLLLDMLAALPDTAHLLIIGSGPEEIALRQTAQNYGVHERIHWLGDLPYSDLPRYLNCLDVGVVPSQTTPRWKEQFGRVLIELMSCEVPVIGSDSGSIPEVVGEAGKTFHENAVTELVEHVKALSMSPERCRELGELGRKRVLAHYSLTIMCEKFLRMYQVLYNA